jgi:hypothetical protein
MNWFSEMLQRVAAVGHLYGIKDDPTEPPVPQNRALAGPPGHWEKRHSRGHRGRNFTGNVSHELIRHTFLPKISDQILYVKCHKRVKEEVIL